MLAAFGADITVHGNEVTITNKNELQGTNVTVPGDISSAAFFLVAAAIVPNSVLTLKDVGLNVTRTGIMDVLKNMNAKIEINNTRKSGGELLGDITITYNELKSTVDRKSVV